jgi:hypothetical protein
MFQAFEPLSTDVVVDEPNKESVTVV